MAWRIYIKETGMEKIRSDVMELLSMPIVYKTKQAVPVPANQCRVSLAGGDRRERIFELDHASSPSPIEAHNPVKIKTMPLLSFINMAATLGMCCPSQ